jgi:uncharacterized protein YaiI (UPF0178 family)/GNAT superfamily N-acetyltransferase
MIPPAGFFWCIGSASIISWKIVTDDAGDDQPMTAAVQNNDACQIHVDADACPIGARFSIERLARHYHLKLFYYIDDSHELYPEYGQVRQVGQGHDAVDLALVNQIRGGDIVVTQDYGLAALVLSRRAVAIHPSGKLYTEKNIDNLLAERHLAARARKAGERFRQPKKRKREDELNLAGQLKRQIELRQVESNEQVLIRRFRQDDASEVSSLVCRNFLEINIKDYPEVVMQELAQSYTADKISSIAAAAHTYVACQGAVIVGCGSIASFEGRADESILLTIFILPECHGQGIGRAIMRALENDEFFFRAKRIEIHSSITACEFYRKLGYDHHDGVKRLDEEGLYRLEKFRYQ